MSNLTLRTMTPDDVPACMALKERAGWNQTTRDWLTFVELRPEGAFVATVDQEVVGTATTVDYGGQFSWIGMMLVSPDHRRKGIRSRLMRACIDSLSNCRTVKLDATPTGRRLYDTLGFQPEYTLTRMACNAVPKAEGEADVDVRPMAESDLDQVTAFDTPFFGAERGPVLRRWFHNAPESAFILREQGRVAAFSMARLGSHRACIGPVVGKTQEQAEHLILRALRDRAGEPVVIDVFEHTTTFLDALEELGFSAQRGFTRMFLGPNQAPGLPAHQWAIAGPAVG